LPRIILYAVKRTVHWDRRSYQKISGTLTFRKSLYSNETSNERVGTHDISYCRTKTRITSFRKCTRCACASIRCMRVSNAMSRCFGVLRRFVRITADIGINIEYGSTGERILTNCFGFLQVKFIVTYNIDTVWT